MRVEPISGLVNHQKANAGSPSLPVSLPVSLPLSTPFPVKTQQASRLQAGKKPL